MFINLQSAIYPVSDLAKAKIWYTKVLGVQPFFDEPVYVGFKVAGYELGLLPEGKASQDGSRPLWGVADAKKTYEDLLKNGAKPLDAVVDVGGGMLVGSVLDPFGNRISFIENPHYVKP